MKASLLPADGVIESHRNVRVTADNIHGNLRVLRSFSERTGVSQLVRMPSSLRRLLPGMQTRQRYSREAAAQDQGLE